MCLSLFSPFLFVRLFFNMFFLKLIPWCFFHSFRSWDRDVCHTQWPGAFFYPFPRKPEVDLQVRQHPEKGMGRFSPFLGHSASRSITMESYIYPDPEFIPKKITRLSDPNSVAYPPDPSFKPDTSSSPKKRHLT